MKLKNAFILFMAAFIWGIAFVAQSVGMDYVGPYTFNGIRSLIGSCFLFLVILGRQCLEKNSENEASKKQEDNKTLIKGGLVCGIVLTVASTLQQFGLIYTTVGKAGFITALYIVIVPIIEIFLKKKVKATVWIGVCIAVVGLYFLCMKESLRFEKGDLFVVLCALVFALHIIVVDYYSPKVDGVKLSCIQFLVCGVVCSTLMLIFEQVDVHALLRAAIPILYAGIFSCGFAYTFQIIGQKDMNPTICSLILSMESVISAVAGFVILHQAMSVREIIGCVLMFGAIILTQIKK